MFARYLALGVLAAAPPTFAGDKPIRNLFAGSQPAPKAKAAKTYPLSELHYIKKFAGPTIPCGSCFGFYHTQWRSWAEACNEPQPVDAGPQKYDAPVEPVPEIEKPRENPPAPKPAVKPPEPKVPEKKPEAKKPEKQKVELPPLIPAPLPAVQPIPLNNIQIVMPAPPQPKPIPVLPNEPMPIIPTIIVPLESK